MGSTQPKKIAVYTAVFGQKDFLQEPTFLTEGCDYVCFTDQPFRSKTWQIRKVSAPFPSDLTRSNRLYKFFPNRFLPEYEYSVYVDGNMRVRGDMQKLINQNLEKANIAFFDHAMINAMQCDCIYDEAQTLYEMARKGKQKEDPAIIARQMEHYRSEGYPAHNGLITAMVIVRRHNELDVAPVMESWWKELTTFAKRDQLSFNYVAWRDKINYAVIPGDSTDNEYFLRVSHWIPFHRRVRSRLIGLSKRMKRITSKNK